MHAIVQKGKQHEGNVSSWLLRTLCACAPKHDVDVLGNGVMCAPKLTTTTTGRALLGLYSFSNKN